MPACHAGGRGFEPLPRRHFLSNPWFVSAAHAGVAQLAEQLICNQQVAGSSPIASSIISYHGWVPEWPKGADCKSAVADFGGSNPPLPIILAGMAELADALDSGSSVRLGHAGSSPVSRTRRRRLRELPSSFLFVLGIFCRIRFAAMPE